MYLTGLLLFALICTFLLTFCWSQLAIKKNWFDIPNQRSSHLVPTPNSGGVGFISVYTILVAALFATGYLAFHEFFLCFLGLLLACVGLVDDMRALGILSRLCIQFLLVLLAVYFLPGLPELPMPGFRFSAGLLMACIVVIAWVWLINLYNFMDGIDALAACEAIFIALALAWIAAAAELESLALLALLLAVVVSGFLYFNLPAAKVFMGDCGSNFLGFILGGLGLLAVWQEAMTLWTFLILIGVFAVDSTQTLLKRMAAGLVWYHGHRSHAYQMASRRYNSHQKIVIAVGLINVFWLLPLAWFSVAQVDSGLWLTMVAWLPLICLAHKYQSLDTGINWSPASGAKPG